MFTSSEESQVINYGPPANVENYFLMSLTLASRLEHWHSWDRNAFCAKEQQKKRSMVQRCRSLVVIVPCFEMAVINHDKISFDDPFWQFPTEMNKSSPTVNCFRMKKLSSWNSHYEFCYYSCQIVVEWRFGQNKNLCGKPRYTFFCRVSQWCMMNKGCQMMPRMYCYGWGNSIWLLSHSSSMNVTMSIVGTFTSRWISVT